MNICNTTKLKLIEKLSHEIRDFRHLYGNIPLLSHYILEIENIEIKKLKKNFRRNINKERRKRYKFAAQESSE